MHRQVIDAIAFKYRTGTPWMDLPEHLGSWKGAHNRLRRSGTRQADVRSSAGGARHRPCRRRSRAPRSCDLSCPGAPPRLAPPAAEPVTATAPPGKQDPKQVA
ncbi:transposase [Streptomyces sp. NBC_00273]|uniref:transposase n=1 Tax=Streptomyces sp. NBC_00273 TaxID=2903644 RepID=UPI003FA696D9